jgi:hypothetical protein
MDLGWPPSKIVSDDADFLPKMATKLKIAKRGMKLKINILL